MISTTSGPCNTDKYRPLGQVPDARSAICVSPTVQMKPLTDALYFQGAADQNISSARPLSKLLIQMSPLGLGKASHTNRRSDLKGEQEIPRLPEQAGAARTGCAEKQEGCPRRVPAPGLSRRHYLKRTLPEHPCPSPSPGPEAQGARVSGTLAYPQEGRGAQPGSRRGPRGPRWGLPPCRSRPGPGCSGSLRCSRPGGTGAPAVAPLRRRRLLLPACRPGAPGLGVRGSETRGSSGRSRLSGTLRLHSGSPARGPAPGDASLEALGRQRLRARGGGGRVGPGAAGRGAAADAGTDAGAAARPLAMAPRRAGGSHLPSALPSPPDARRALPLPSPARRPAPPPAGRPPGFPPAMS
nr:translation initiation factor IF-2-like [Chlorocebus sabaeus]